ALAKDSSTYEHIAPELVGNERSVMVSQQAGKSNLLTALHRHGIALAKDDPQLDVLLRTVKEREARGYSYDGADASFALLARKVLGTLPEFFKVLGYSAEVARRFNARGEIVVATQAWVKMEIDGDTTLQIAEGNGPINALD